MSPADLEELYLVVIRAPAVILLFLSLWGTVMLVLQALKVDCQSVLALPKIEERPRASHRQVLVTASAFFTALVLCLYTGEALMHDPNMSLGAFYVVAGVVLAFQAKNCIGDNVSFISQVLWLILMPGADVQFTEVFVADALTSLNRVIADVGCAAALLAFSWTGGDVCPPNFKVLLRAALMALPYWLRVRQCRILYRNEVDARRKKLHLLNIFKYLSAFPLITLSALEAIQPPGVFRQRLGAAAATAAVFNSGFCLCWDVRMDWGLAQRGARRPGLRNTTLLSRAAWPYYAAIAVDAALRMVWVVKYWAAELPFTDLVMVLELVEVCRRSVWNVFRLEWEVIQSGAAAGRVHHAHLKADAGDNKEDARPLLPTHRLLASENGGGSSGSGA